MNAKKFVAELAKVRSPGVFNPYSDICVDNDDSYSISTRIRNLEGYLAAVESLGADTLWMGRDLGYRGGRRTGLALTDESHLRHVAKIYPGANPIKATKSPEVAERTASEIWSALMQINLPPLLWNVFPFHPHEIGQPYTNRRFKSVELAQVDELNQALVRWLKIKRVICLGQDAAKYATSLSLDVICVRHPSYGGVAEFRRGIGDAYGVQIKSMKSVQYALFDTDS